jgi:hypothetical protein
MCARVLVCSCARVLRPLLHLHDHDSPVGIRRYVVQSLPLILLGGIAVVMAGTKVLQLVQSKVFHVLPFGALSATSLSDVCIGILISGLFMLYFGMC